jgi:5-methylcytosine-specific restriction protein A
MRDAFDHIARGYLDARSMPLKDNSLAHFIRNDAAAAVARALGPAFSGFKITGSPGQGNWAEVPWIAVFDTVVTESATRGYYIVYLFSSDMTRLSLSLNQGTTSVRAELGAETRNELMRRAAIIRSRIPEAIEHFTSAPIELSATGQLSKDYEAGHAFGITYQLDALPSGSSLEEDLRNMTRLYLMLTSRGGIELSEGHEQAADEAGLQTIVEQRRYTFHRRIERDSSASRAAKKIHGYVCQACGFDFEAVYGPVGHQFIEAHHLTPISVLPQDKPVEQDPKTDFAVLCSNCHRMIHRMPDVGNVTALSDTGAVRRLARLHADLKQTK